jgi:hypothetical protein
MVTSELAMLDVINCVIDLSWLTFIVLEIDHLGILLLGDSI